MKRRTVLFVAAQNAFGEALLGLRIAHDLHARGHRVVLLAGENLAVLTEGVPFETLPFSEGDHARGVARRIADAVARVRPDAVVLLDVTLVYLLLKAQGTDASFLGTVGAPVIGLDVWDIEETGLQWDVCGAGWELSKHSLDVKRRLIPVPFARPSDGPGRYDALPTPAVVRDDDVVDARADLGLGRDDRLVLLTSARWQHPSVQAHDDGKRLATSLPSLAGELLGRLGARVKVVHVGPEAWAMPPLGKRYTWLSQRTPSRFATLLAAADLLVSFNYSATTIVSAVATGLPVLLAVSSFEGGADDVLARLPGRPSDAMKAWLRRNAPISPYWVWPLGIRKFLGPLTEGNPYTDALRITELLDEEAFGVAARSLLFDASSRERARADQAAYRTVVAKLPKGADLLESYLGA